MSAVQRLRITIRGAVQGVGFRPFVYHLATSSGLVGWVCNAPHGITLEVEGLAHQLQRFAIGLRREKPVHASIQGFECVYLDPRGYTSFEIRPSMENGPKTAVALPDIASCSACIQEIFDPANRRYRYPFTNCTHCGPRYSIMEALPYDRPHTTMKKFRMCHRCQAEYQNPLDRRFHAQPIACASCGPQLALRDIHGQELAERDQALRMAAQAILEGSIVALKGIGGFQLFVNAKDRNAVLRLRERKHRDEKPFALMCPDLTTVKQLCHVSALEEHLLASAEAPIVLLSRLDLDTDKTGSWVETIAPRNPCLGIMLPYSPLHHLLMAELQGPVIATSGNLSDEPICIEEQEAQERLSGIADLFLTHDRPIVRCMDDSVVRIVENRELVIRRARGYAPFPITLQDDLPSLLSVGAHLKNTVALTAGKSVFLSQHIGDLQSLRTFESFQTTIQDLKSFYNSAPKSVACDLHPDYLSTQFADRQKLAVHRVQHHYAHVLACMAENEIEAPALGVCWDGTGYGLNQTIWGGEFLDVSASNFERLANWRIFPLPGNEKAVREPARCALGLLYEIFGKDLFDRTDLNFMKFFSPSFKTLLRQLLMQNINTPRTSSVGRLFDAVASLLDLRQKASYEAQAAMELEGILPFHGTDDCYPIHVAIEEKPWVVDWEPMIRAILSDLQCDISPGLIAARFHNTLAEAIVQVAKRADRERVVLSGGCFQNRYLTERAVRRLREEKFHPYWHQRIPPNDGGIALGQIMATLRAQKEEMACASAFLGKS